jgi:hypothetical protein
MDSFGFFLTQEAFQKLVHFYLETQRTRLNILNEIHLHFNSVSVKKMSYCTAQNIMCSEN